MKNPADPAREEPRPPKAHPDDAERRAAPADEPRPELPKLPLFRIRPATPRSGIEFEDTADK